MYKNKQCSLCKKTLSLRLFSYSKRDGYFAHCKICHRQYHFRNHEQKKKKLRQDYYKNREQNILRARKYYWDNREYVLQRVKQYRQRPDVMQRKAELNKLDSPIKLSARRKLTKAVFLGVVKKPNKCQHCKKKFPKKNINAHHYDYSKPFSVIWLCHQCHTNLHRFNPKCYSNA